jgi:hypothetical protein
MNLFSFKGVAETALSLCANEQNKRKASDCPDFILLGTEHLRTKAPTGVPFCCGLAHGHFWPVCTVTLENHGASWGPSQFFLADSRIHPTKCLLKVCCADVLMKACDPNYSGDRYRRMAVGG